MSEDDRPKTPEESAAPGKAEVTGTPEAGDLDEGLTAEERAMLESLSPGASPQPSPAPDAAPVGAGGNPPDALTSEEEVMIAERGEMTVDEEPAVGEETPDTTPEAPEGTGTSAPAVGELTPEEEEVLKRIRDESERVSREELPAMFEKPVEAADESETPAAEAAPDEPLAAEVIKEEHVEVPTSDEEPEAPTSAMPPGKIARILAAPLDLINLPFRWLPPVWRMGLGLCGVLLLITLLLVILVRMIFES